MKKLKTKTKPKKPDRYEFARVLDAIQQAIGYATALSKGKHEARAELLAPTLKAIKRCADTQGRVDSGVVLQPGDCLLLLVCLAEAGYRLPTQAGTPDGAFRQDAKVWQVVKDGEAPSVAHPVAKAA